MKHVKIAALMCALALVMPLAGCSKDDGAPESAINSANFGDEIVITVGNRKVTKSEYNYYLTRYRNTFDMEEAKQQALDYCENHNLLIELGEKMKIKFDSDTKKEIKDTKNQIIENNEQINGYEEFLKENDITDEFIDDLISVSYYSDALKEQMEPKEYTDEEKREFFKNNYRRAKHILLTTTDAETGDELPEEEVAAIKERAEELLQRARNGEDFDALVAEYSEDPGSQSNPDGYVFTDNEMVSEFQDGVDSINPGEFTLVKTVYGYHVIQRLSLDEDPEYFEEQYQDAAAGIDSVMDGKRFEEQVQAWAEEYGIEITVNREIIDAME